MGQQPGYANMRQARNVSTRPIRRLHQLPLTLVHLLPPKLHSELVNKKPLFALHSCTAAACQANPLCIRQSKTSVPMSAPRESSLMCNVQNATNVDQISKSLFICPAIKTFFIRSRRVNKVKSRRNDHNQRCQRRATDIQPAGIPGDNQALAKLN